MAYGRRRNGPPVKLILGGIVFGIIAITGVLFWAAGKAESNPPEQNEIRVEATNVGPF